MFGGNTLWWAGLITFLLFVIWNILVFFLRKNPKISYRIAWIIALYLLLYKITDYARLQIIGEHSNIPVDFSAVSYFLYGIFIVFMLRKAETFPIYIAMFSSIMYLVTGMFFPDSYFMNMPDTYVAVAAYINHNIMYFGTMLMLFNVRKEPLKNWWQLPIFFGVVIGYSWLIYLTTDYEVYSGKPFVCKVTDSTLIQWLFPGKVLTPSGVVGYYIFISVTLLATMVLYFVINRIGVNYRKRHGIVVSYEPKWHELFGEKAKKKV